ncbi:MAG: hypothetical protein GEU90_10130 [Gemmatimonas sp.]|nr:hypothetical protein [Gemmatimonas sp.]
MNSVDPLVRKRRWPWILGCASAGVILLATLIPVPQQSDSGISPICVLCSDFALADAIRNVVLFAPLGIALGAGRLSGRWVVLLAAALSAGVESAQIFVVPGRDGNPMDIVSNSIGAWVGMRIARSAPFWIDPQGRGRAVLAVGGALVGAGLLLLSLALLRPAPTESTYFGQWTADFRSLERYEGEVVAAWIGSDPIQSGRLDNSAVIRDHLLRREPIRITAVAGPPTEGLAPLFSVADRRQRMLLLVGVDGSDLVFQQRLLATATMLDRPHVRVRDAFDAVRVGDTMHVALRWMGDGYCVAVDRREECGISLSVGRGWSLLQYSDETLADLAPLLDALWIALLFLPAAYWAAGDPRLILLVAATGVASVAVGAAASASVVASVPDYLAVFVGVGLGLLQRRVTRAVKSRSRVGC